MRDELEQQRRNIRTLEQVRALGTDRAARSESGISTSRTHVRYCLRRGRQGSARTAARNSRLVLNFAWRSIASYADFDAVTQASNGPYNAFNCSLTRSTRARCRCARSECSAVVR